MNTGRVSVGHPVDVASGMVFTICEDFVLTGTYDLIWRRNYSNDSPVHSWLGRGWTVPYFMKMDHIPEGYLLTSEDGSPILFQTPDRDLDVGETNVNLVSNMMLRNEGSHFSILHWHHEEGEVERYCFERSDDGSFQLAWCENLAGHRIRIEYDPNHRPVLLFQELEQRTLEITYNNVDLISSINLISTNGEPRLLSRYEYDNNRQLIAAFDAMGNRTTYQYDSKHRMVSETNPLGSTFVFRYDQLGRCIHTYGDDRFMERILHYNTMPPMTRVTDSLGNTTTYYLNSGGQVIQEVSPLGSPTTTEYDEFGRIMKIIHPDGGEDQYAYDEYGNRTMLVDPCGGTINIQFNELHLPTQITDEKGSEWIFEYDDHGNIISSVNPLGYRWGYQLDSRNLVSQATTPGGLIISHRYDQALRWQESSDQISFIDRREYDELGNETAYYDSLGLVQSVRFDQLNRPIEIKDSKGQKTRMSWNPSSEMIELVEPGHKSESWNFNRFGLLVSHTNALGHTMVLEYDTEEHLTAVINRSGERMEFLYDTDGNVVTEKLFDGRVQNYKYDLSNRCVEIIKSDKRVVTQEFDKCGRLIVRRTSDGLVEEFGYDMRGLLIRALNNDVSIELERNALGRVVAEVQNGHRIEYEYDADNNRSSRFLKHFKDGELRANFDVRGRLTSITDSSGVCQALNWDNVDRLIERRFPDGVKERFSFNPAGNLMEQKVMVPYETIILRRYTYDEVDTLIASDDSLRGKTEFYYDSIGRLTKAHRPTGLNKSYTYDPIGTILQAGELKREVASGGTTISDGIRTYDYDKDGCISKIRDKQYTLELKYDVDGKLTKAKDSDGAEITYTYDPLGRRVSKEVSGKKTEFIWEGCEPAAEINNGEVSDVFFFMDREPIAQWRNGQQLIPITDKTGAVQELLSRQGDIIWECSLDAYGNLLSENSSAGSPFRFRGQYFDSETGFHYNFFRSYDPIQGNFISPDPLGIAGGSNFYAYPRNPLSWDDPFGLSCGPPNKHKGNLGETRMNKFYKDLGYKPIHGKNRPRGIDGIYYKRGGKPPYVIVEAKYGSSNLKRTRDGNKQMSDNWIDAPIGGSGKDRLERAVGSKAVADRIRTQSKKGNVGKELYHAPAGKPGDAYSMGSYASGSGKSEVEWD